MVYELGHNNILWFCSLDKLVFSSLSAISHLPVREDEKTYVGDRDSKGFRRFHFHVLPVSVAFSDNI